MKGPYYFSGSTVSLARPEIETTTTDEAKKED